MNTNTCTALAQQDDVMPWHLSNRAVPRGAALADRHYSRKTSGAAQFTTPGRGVVLLTSAGNALWVSFWPYWQYVKYDWRGAWRCSLFRNESQVMSSTLIAQAVAWHTVVPVWGRNGGAAMPRVRAVLTPDEHLQVFVLDGLFPLSHAFVLNSALGTLLHLSIQPDMPHPVLLAEQQFTEQELSLVVRLLTNYPEFAPMEELSASFCYGSDGLSEQRIDQAREHVHEALEEGVWDKERRPLRNVLSRARFKLCHLGWDAVNLLETGSLLMANTRRKPHE